MTKIFLKAKHWQLFLLSFGIPMILQVVLMAYMFMKTIGNHNVEDSMSFMFNYMIIVFVVVILFSSIIHAWHWSVVMGLQSKVPKDIKMKLGRFKVFFFIPLVYILLLPVFVFTMIRMATTAGEPDFAFFAPMILIIPLHLFSMFCIFHTIYFIAKTLKTVELQREADFSDFVGEFFMVWFYPVGVWFLQPKINKMIEA